MIWGKILQGMGLVLLLSSLNIATAAKMRQWEGAFVEENEAEGQMPRGFEESMPDSEKGTSPDVVEVVWSKLKPNEIKVPRQNLALVQISSNTQRKIKDETAITGQNAKKKLPMAVKKADSNQSLFGLEIDQAILHSLVFALSEGN